MAIVIDNTASLKTGATSGTFAHVVSAGLSDSLLLLTISLQDSNHANLPINTATYAGSAMTKVRQDTSNTNNVSAAVFYLVNPNIGTNNVVMTSTGAVWKGAISSSWSGVQQSAQPDAQNGKGTANQSASVASQIGTTVANNSLIVGIVSSEAPMTGKFSDFSLVGVGTLQGQSFENSASVYKALATAGAGTAGGTLSSSSAYNISWVSFSPVIEAETFNSWRSLSGVGI